MGALGSVTDLYAAEAESGMAWFLYLFIFFFIVTIKTHIPFPSHHNKRFSLPVVIELHTANAAQTAAI